MYEVKETNNHKPGNPLIQQDAFTTQDSQEMVQAINQTHLGLESAGYTTNSAMLYGVLMTTASILPYATLVKVVLKISWTNDGV